MSLLLAIPLGASATTLAFDAKVTRTLASDGEKFGGCMAFLSVSPVDQGLDCASSWVTFSCTGEHVTKSSALRMFDSAQMAFLMDRLVRVTVDDTRKHNNYCLVERIDVLNRAS
ncbi:MAG: hypothetical protein F4X36_14815 [Gammaproteobacteria bacterium]|nr:hypothetical protein [Gammaproteobacteria bacterium]